MKKQYETIEVVYLEHSAGIEEGAIKHLPKSIGLQLIERGIVKANSEQEQPKAKAKKAK